MATVLSILFIIICPLIIGIVLMQDPKGGGLAGALGGTGGGSAFGAKTADVVMKVTIVLGIVFFMLALGMSYAVKSTAEAPPSIAPEAVPSLPVSSEQPLPAESAPETEAPAESGSMVAEEPSEPSEEASVPAQVDQPAEAAAPE